jgi:hypothetical protein
MNDKLQGIHFDLEYSIDTVVNMYKTKPTFDVISLIKNIKYFTFFFV